MADRLFLDTSYALALASRTDEHHARAFELAAQIEKSETPLLTTWAIVLEIGNALARARFRAAAVAMLDAVLQDPAVEVVPADRELCERALDLYRARADKEWGLTDCVSFVVMRDRGLLDALTADDHFRQAGFRALLLATD